MIILVIHMGLEWSVFRYDLFNMPKSNNLYVFEWNWAKIRYLTPLFATSTEHRIARGAGLA